MSGLFLNGTVMGRSKRFVGENNTEVVAYRISDGNSIYFVDHWEPKSYYALGNEVNLPVSVKPYVKNANVYLSYSVKSDRHIGEEF